MPSIRPTILALACAATLPRVARSQEANVVVRNARIWTGDTLAPRAQAVAIRDERLIVVGLFRRRRQRPYRQYRLHLRCLTASDEKTTGGLDG